MNPTYNAKQFHDQLKRRLALNTEVSAAFATALTQGPKLVTIASADEVNYAVYCQVMDQMCLPVGQVVAFDFSLPGILVKAFGDLKQLLTDIANDFKVGFEEVVKAFKQKDVFALLKGVAFNVKALWKALTAFTSLVPKGLFKAFDALVKSGALDGLRKGTMKIDEILHAHPLLTKLAGIALAGLLLWIWLSMSFTGNPQFDFDVAVIVAAFKGQFDLTDLFLSADGLTMLTLLGAGLFTGLGVAWLASNIANLAIAFVFTGARKMNDMGLVNKLKTHLEPKKY
jgi:hypothetical protein